MFYEPLRYYIQVWQGYCNGTVGWKIFVLGTRIVRCSGIGVGHFTAAAAAEGYPGGQVEHRFQQI